MTQEIKRADVWTLADYRDVLVVSLTGLDEAYGAVLTLVLHPADGYLDTAISVVLRDPIPCTAIAVNLQQLTARRFDDATYRGTVDPATMARVDHALQAVLDI
ncbi:hypothetical protein [Streptomyces sp. NPDC056713]|uniref:hypothetical protein n=1 Tax=Streptomyces sp. NPDC056713 TaxID=3345921 RepID=UPI0036C10529